MRNDRKEKFIPAYMWMFGVSKKQANIIWKAVKTRTKYVDAIITTWEDNARKEFYND